MRGITPELGALFVVAIAGLALIVSRAYDGIRAGLRVFVEVRWVIIAALLALPAALALAILVYFGWSFLPARAGAFRIWGALGTFGLLSFAFVTLARDLRGSLVFSLPGAMRGVPWFLFAGFGIGFIGLTAKAATLPQAAGLHYVLSHELVRFGALGSGVFFLLGVLSALLPWVLDRLEHLRFDTFIGARHVRATKSGFLTVVSLLSIGGVGFSSFTLCGSVSIMGGFGQDLKRKILGNNAHLIVDKPGDQNGFADYEPMLERIRAVPGVMGVTPVVSGDAMASCNANTAGVAVRGIDPKTIGDVIDLVKNVEYGKVEYLEDEQKLANLPPDEIIGGSTTGEQFKKGTDFPTLTHNLDPAVAAVLRGPTAYPGIVIGRELARTLHLMVGDEVTLVSPLGDLGPMGVLPRSRRFRIAAVFYSGMYEYDATHVYLRMDVAQKFFSLEEHITNVEVKVKDAEATEQIMAPVTTAVGDASLRVRDWRELNKNLFSALKLERIVAFLILSIAIAVASFCIICTLLLMVTEKGKEIAIMKALGTSDGTVQRIFMIEGIIIGAIGTTFGVATGVAACLGLRWFGVRLDPDVYYIDRLPVATNASDYLVVAASAMLICTLATIYPAKAASRLRPVDGLRYE